MVRLRKGRTLFSILLLIIVILLIKLISLESPSVSSKLIKKNNTRYTVIIREFESFDNDVVDTTYSVLNVCGDKCQVLVMSDDLIYPPLALPPQAKVIKLNPDILEQPPNLAQLLQHSQYVVLLPDGTRWSSSSQLQDLIVLLENGDSQVVGVGVGGGTLTCHRYNLDLRAWSLSIAPSPHSEACDSVSGRVTLILRTQHLLNLTHPLARPVQVSLGLQGAARGWKVHLTHGMVLGEGRQLFSNEHLQWKRQTLNDERQKGLFHIFGIKKVVRSSQEVEWYGCSRKTPRCFPTVVDDTPDYLYRSRWTPPCCLEGLRATARHVFQSLRACRARWWLEGGSLLGAVRSGDIIPWDYDVDVGIYAADVDRCQQLKSSRWQTVEDQDGYVWQRATEGKFYRVHYSATNHLHVDIFPFTPRDGLMTRGQWPNAHKQDQDFPEHFLRPISTISFAGVMAAAPNNVRDFLELKFGVGVVENPQYPNPAVLAYNNISARTPL
ncbi:ribitol 5-phosphate transferase FKRP isoform X1 [Oratosquilla oratoria]|uniref:ribitol 5-phosphate transferase FKRP isoform X1 n=1 Tax=Oratosquilla oratoria TaxID=337810 RepID=UPI003F760770